MYRQVTVKWLIFLQLQLQLQLQKYTLQQKRFVLRGVMQYRHVETSRSSALIGTAGTVVWWANVTWKCVPDYLSVNLSHTYITFCFCRSTRLCWGLSLLIRTPTISSSATLAGLLSFWTGWSKAPADLWLHLDWRRERYRIVILTPLCRPKVMNARLNLT